MLAAGLGAAALLGGCGEAGADDEERIAVVATTPYVADFVSEVGGDSVEVEQIIPANVDPHVFEPRPADADAFADAELVVLSGRGIDDWAETLLAKSGGDARIVNLGVTGPIRLPGAKRKGGETRGAGSSEIEGGGHTHSHAGEFDPHWWHDPRNVEAALPAIENALAVTDPSRREEFIRNADAYAGELRALGAGIDECIASVPAGRRKMVTDDPSFAYFANRYGLELIGVTIPTRLSRGKASARELDELVATIASESVGAIFPRRSLETDVIEAIARRAGASTAYSLYGDTLGPEGSDGDTYLRMEAANADAVVRGLTGGRVGCDLARRLK